MRAYAPTPPHAHFKIALSLPARTKSRRLLIEKHAYGEMDPSGRRPLESWRCSCRCRYSCSCSGIGSDINEHLQWLGREDVVRALASPPTPTPTPSPTPNTKCRLHTILALAPSHFGILPVHSLACISSASKSWLTPKGGELIFFCAMPTAVELFATCSRRCVLSLEQQRHTRHLT